MKIISHIDVESFLRDTRAQLEANEAANSLMLGICGQLLHQPELYPVTPCLKTVGDEKGLVLAAVMTPPHKLVVYGHQGDLYGAARLLVEELDRDSWNIPGVLGPGEAAARFATQWTEVTGKRVYLEQQQRLYMLVEVNCPSPKRGRLRPATEIDIELVTCWWREFNLDIFGEADPEGVNRSVRFRIGEGHIYLWEDERPVSMAMKTRPTRRGISVGLVYTPPELRRRGYATACVGELSRSLLQAGWEFCTLFTDLSNATSNHIYQAIGYRLVCDYEQYAFPNENHTA